MIFSKSWSGRPLSVLDFGPKAVVAILAQHAPSGFRILGGGTSDAQGVRSGRIEHLGDAVESVVEAVSKAERAAGTRAGRVYYNLSDTSLTSVYGVGSKNLAGQGEIAASDVRAARAAAERMFGDFSRTILYSTETAFLIDERDPVSDPVGVFGQKLDVSVHAVLADAENLQSWKTLMRRANVKKSQPVLTARSVAAAVVPKEDRLRRRLIMDAGADLTQAFVFGAGRILDLRTWSGSEADPDALRELVERSPAEEALVTGDAADEKLVSMVARSTGLNARLASPSGIEKLAQPAYAALAGLLQLADTLERSGTSKPRAEGGVLGGLRQQATTFINEYF